MGVTGLWTVVQPCARPIKLETLNKKRLAVDASIWIYQFLKAVRDKEGNALRNSHIVGFFRRICKLLYVGIRPVFVFDGGAPVLKRETINKRKSRREGRREDASRTAGKLLAIQMQRIAEEEAQARRNEKKRAREGEEEVTGAPVYAEEILMTDQERQRNRKFKKTDAYHLPNLDVSLEDMGAPNDPRIMSQQELQEYARQFHQGHDINLYDFSKIDFDSPFFLSLPATDRYNILNAARLRSRLRMGYSKEQLDIMFPNRMDFSRFQIERVAERNDLTQRLMNINGMNGEEAYYKSGQRIAGERGKEYVLVKDNQNAGGWVLGVVGNKNEGQEDKPIDVDMIGVEEALSGSDVDSDEDEFEDVPIEGLNRLPRLPFIQEEAFDSTLPRAFRNSSAKQSQPKKHEYESDEDSLFVPIDEDAETHTQTRRVGTDDEDENELQKAINLSLQPNEEYDYDIPDIPINRPVDPQPFHGPLTNLSDESEDDGMDFAAALAQSKKPASKLATHNPFDGPLPFESIKLRKAPQDDKPSHVDEGGGGFITERSNSSQKAEPIPPWFAAERVNEKFLALEDSQAEPEDSGETDHLFLSNRRAPEIINVDELPDSKDEIKLDDDSEKQNQSKRIVHADEPREKSTEVEISNPISVEPELLESSTSDKPADVTIRELLTVQSSPEPEFEDVASKVVPSVSDSTEVKMQETPLETPSVGLEFQDVPSNAVVSNLHSEQPERQDPPLDSLSPQPEFEDVLPKTTTETLEITQTPSTIIPTVNTYPQPPTENEANMDGDFDFSDPEDEELMQQLAEETEEHARFTQALNSAAPIQTTLDYEQELKQLRNQQQKDRRDADEVTQIMINECQQLLQLFGLPYITAPMEAEAQCAELVSLGLVDGIVTDDSDTFLFGGTRVYKNMFNQSKYVECYLTSDFEKEYSLHRRKLISFAHLLGSDYTEGVPGIGPVTALEIVTEFSSLSEFRDWWSNIQMGVNDPNDTHLAFRKKFRKKAAKIFLPPVFPDERVENAYLEPEVDSDPSQFQWGVPDLNGLRNFLMATIGWSQERTDEVLVPVIRDMNRREQEGTQSNITQFMQGPQGAGAFAPRLRTGGPSRMEKAFGRLQQQAQLDRESYRRADPANTVDKATSSASNSTSNSTSQSKTKKGKAKNSKRSTK